VSPSSIGAVVPVSATSAYQPDNLSFGGTAGNQANLRVLSSIYGSVSFQLLSADGSVG
jgi:hypothetical protein